MSQRKTASRVDGYFTIMLRDIKNGPRRNRYYNDIDLDFLLELYELQEGKCAVTGIEMTLGYGKEDEDRNNKKRYRKPFNLSVDRIDSEKGYTKDNVILVCNCVNFFKNNLSMEQVYDISESIIKNKGRMETTKRAIDKKLHKEGYINESESTSESASNLA